MYDINHHKPCHDNVTCPLEWQTSSCSIPTICKAYISGLCKGISPWNMTLYGTLSLCWDPGTSIDFAVRISRVVDSSAWTLYALTLFSSDVSFFTLGARQKSCPRNDHDMIVYWNICWWTMTTHLLFGALSLGFMKQSLPGWWFGTSFSKNMPSIGRFTSSHQIVNWLV